MTNLDQFESVFKSAAKTPFLGEDIQIQTCLVISDLDGQDASSFMKSTRAFAWTLDESTSWEQLGRTELSSIGNMLAKVDEFKPDLIITYRNLCTVADEHPYSLGVHLDVLTQATTIPVLVMPNQNGNTANSAPVKSVMAIADHLSGDHHLVNFAAYLTPPDGNLWLVHVEDESTFDRYMEAISKIPEIETDTARDLIYKQLLKEPADYIDSCRHVLSTAHRVNNVEKLVTVGHHLTDYKSLIAEHNIDLLVLNTKDEGQLAMHGVAYSLTVELRETPLLLL